MKWIKCFFTSHQWTEWSLIHGYGTNLNFKMQEVRNCTCCTRPEYRVYKGRQ